MGLTTNVLDLAVKLDNVEIVKFLISTGKVTQVSWEVLQTSKNEMDRVLKPFIWYNPYDMEDTLQVFVMGNSGVGKSTLVQAMLRKLDIEQLEQPHEAIVSVEPNTAGIALTRTSGYKSSILIHDFAGHHEYYSGHSALVEDVLKRSAALFLCVVDISQPVESQVTYWLDFLESKINTERRKHSCVVVVGSHADKLSEAECTERRAMVMALAERGVVGLNYKGFVHINCREVSSGDLSSLIIMIYNIYSKMHSSMSFYSHVLNEYLTGEFKKEFYTVSELSTALKEKDCYYLPSGEDVLVGFLRELHNRGIILFLEDCQWVVMKKEVLLTEVNGKLFAPESFKEHIDISSNIGIVTISDLSKVFPRYNADMLVGFLKQFEFCYEVDRDIREQITTNLKATANLPTDQLLFFPAFVKVNRPDGIQLGGQGVPVFGCYFELDGSQGVFSTRFLHILLLQLAYKFAVSPTKVSASNSSALSRRCSVWKNGIHWSSNGVKTVVEVTNQNHRVLLAMQCSGKPDASFSKFRSSVICEIILLQQRFCSGHKVDQYLISPMKYPLEDIPADTCLDFVEVAKAIVQNHHSVPDCDEGLKEFQLSEELQFEPYRVLDTQAIAQVFDTEHTSTPVPAAMLQRVRDVAHINMEDGINYGTLRRPA